MLNKGLLYFKVIMSLLFISLGIFYLVKPTENLSADTSRLLGGLLIAYGLFRGYRAYKEFQQVNQND